MREFFAVIIAVLVPLIGVAVTIALAPLPALAAIVILTFVPILGVYPTIWAGKHIGYTTYSIITGTVTVGGFIYLVHSIGIIGIVKIWIWAMVWTVAIFMTLLLATVVGPKLFNGARDLAKRTFPSRKAA